MPRQSHLLRVAEREKVPIPDDTVNCHDTTARSSPASFLFYHWGLGLRGGIGCQQLDLVLLTPGATAEPTQPGSLLGEGTEGRRISCHFPQYRKVIKNSYEKKRHPLTSQLQKITNCKNLTMKKISLLNTVLQSNYI